MITKDKCPKCKKMAAFTNWKPPQGYDPNLYQFKCSCGHIFYLIINSSSNKEG